jgi:diguanylate cyclase (GGDEF)-like protein/PAS domain S-box-containing protein
MKTKATTLEELMGEIVKMREHIQALEQTGKVIQSQEEMYREMVHSANSIILCWNETGRISFINQFALDFFGYHEKEILGRSVLETIVPKEDARGMDMTSLMKDICRHPDRYISNENENIRQNGERVWISWTNKPIYDREKQFLEILSVGNDITRRKKAEDELERLASTDMMTGVLNRRAGLKFLEQGLHLARRKHYKLSICFIDVNNLKWVNDTIGHHEGDEMIRTVCDLLKESLRASDSICRLGGDEFLIILPDCPLSTAKVQWTRFLRRLTAFNKAGKKTYPVSVSHGFAEYEPNEVVPRINDFINLADERMYEEKKKSKASRGSPPPETPS